jgi:hypothetical protein
MQPTQNKRKINPEKLPINDSNLPYWYWQSKKTSSETPGNQRAFSISPPTFAPAKS